MTERGLTEYEKKVLSNVDEFGCHVTYVFDSDGDDPDFAYSTGFTRSLGQGEVITFGLPRDVMLFMINQTMRECRKGLVLEDWERISGLLEGFEVVARKVRPESIERGYFNSAMWFHHLNSGGDLTVAYQLVWPGALDGLYPWDDDCSELVIERQPALYLKGALH